MEFELDRRKFRIKKLSAFGQLHLSRKVAPLLPALAPMLIEISKRAKDEEEKSIQSVPQSSAKEPGFLQKNILIFAELARPVAEALSSMTDQDAEQIFTMTLSSVDVMTDKGVWIALWPAGAKAASLIELDDAAKLLPVVVRVIIHNLGNFMDALLTRREGVEQVSNGGTSLATKTG